jgi:hypothetical protein
MDKKSSPAFVRLIVAAALLGSACILEMIGGPAATPQVILISATGETGLLVPLPTGTPPALTPTFTWTWTMTLTPTQTATFTKALPTLTAGQSLSCVKGPQWILYEWVTSIAEGETVTLIGKASPEWEEYYYVRKSNGTECWAFGGSSTKTGDLSTLLVREAPPLPEVTYIIDNKTGLTVCDVFIRGKDEGVWGADRLGAGTIPAGASKGFAITAGYYDVLVKECFHGVALYEKQDRAIGPDVTYRTTLLNNEVKFYIQNTLPFDLCEFAFRPVGGSWSVLHSAADGHITPGEKVWFTLLVGFYDTQIKRCPAVLIESGVGIYFGPDTVGFP